MNDFAGFTLIVCLGLLGAVILGGVWFGLSSGNWIIAGAGLGVLGVIVWYVTE